MRHQYKSEIIVQEKANFLSKSYKTSDLKTLLRSSLYYFTCCRNLRPQPPGLSLCRETDSQSPFTHWWAPNSWQQGPTGANVVMVRKENSAKNSQLSIWMSLSHFSSESQSFHLDLPILSPIPIFALMFTCTRSWHYFNLWHMCDIDVF